MKELEQLILSKSRPVQREVKQLQKSELDRLIIEAFLGEAPEKCKGLANRGDIAEGIVALALVVKFAKRNYNDNTIGDVTPSDIKALLFSLSSTEDIVSIDKNDFATVKGEVSSAKDKIQYNISMPARAFADLIDPSKAHCLQGEYEGASKYVNSKNLRKFASRLATNQKPNTIIVSAQGTEDQKGTKVDISISVDGEKTRNLISLKAKGGEQFAQKTGKDFKVLESFWNPLGVDISSAQTEYNEIASQIPSGKTFSSREEIDAAGIPELVGKAFDAVYTAAFKELQQKLKDGKFEEDFVENLIKYIRKGAVGEESDVIELVKILPSGFKRARFGPSFENKMKKIDLYPRLSRDGKYPKVEIIAKGKDGKESLLVQMRGKFERASGTKAGSKVYGPLMRNYVESGPALYQIASI